MSAKTKKKNRTPFGATAPPFIDYLKDILRRYPDGGQILKELIQNADDAGATEVIFFHDNRSHGTENLWAEDLAKYQGPALYAYNNAEFTDEDWDGIQSVARSVKRSDPIKWDALDLGSTQFDKYIQCGSPGYDGPSEKIFGAKNGGYRWSLDDEEDQHMLTTMHDQFQPFRDIVSLVSSKEWDRVIQEDQNFNGTLFRFPLRTEPSEISDNLYGSERVDELFGSFIADADLSLLFLKNVSSVSLKHIDAKGSVTTKLEVKSTASQNLNTDLREGPTKGYTTIKHITLESDKLQETKWLVTSCTLTEGHVDQLDKLAEKLKFVPRVDLAFPCDNNTDCSKSRLCCFLPLPNNESNKTGLPVYVNAYFGLTDNRRHIKWLEEDQMNDEHAIWNEMLIKEVLPETYLTIIQDAIRLIQCYDLEVNSIYNLWPDLSKCSTKKNGMRWPWMCSSSSKDERQFVTMSEAVFPCNGPTPLKTLAAIARVLVSRKKNLVTLSDSATRALKEAYPEFSSLTHVTPAFLRDILHNSGVQDISDMDKLTLLEYILSDKQYTELCGLQLLPLSDGSFKSFTNREETQFYLTARNFQGIYIASLVDLSLLPFCQSLFILQDLSSECVYHLRQVAKQNLFLVIDIDANQVLGYTRKHLPDEWKSTDNSHVPWEVSSDRYPPLNWLQGFWSFLNSHFKELSCFTGLPLIPVNTVNPTLIFEKSKQVTLPDIIAKLVNRVGGTVVKENNWLKHEDLDSYVLSPSPQHVLQVFVNLQPQQVINELILLSRLDFLSHREKELLLQLPLFQTMAGEYTAAQSKQAMLFISGLTIPVDLPMPNTVVKCATESDRRLLQLLNISLLETAQAASFLIDVVERRACSKTDTAKIMAWILDHGNILFSHNPNLKGRCTHLVNSFKILFEDCYFPPAVYTKTSQMLASLIDLGLIHKEVDVSPEHLLHAATLIETLTTHQSQEAGKKAQVLLKILDANDLLDRFSHDQIEQLKRLKWVPKSGFSCLEEMRHSMYEDIVGYVMPLEGKFSENLCTKLGLKQPPPPKKVAQNLKVLISKSKEMKSPDTNGDFKRKLRSIYGHMQKSIYDYTTIISTDTKWLWNLQNFPHNLDLSSQIGKVPDEFLLYKHLFQAFGLREELADKEIIEILYTIMKTIEDREVSVATSSEVKVSIDILNWLWREKKVVPDDVLVPVIAQHGEYTLKPKSLAVFCDLSKNGLKELECSQEEMHVVHEEMPIATAEWLGIQLLSTYILDPKSIGIEQYYSKCRGCWGTTCKFLLDFRVHKDDPESLIDPDMKLCQGPCVWAFNNEQFSSNDWDNIVKVGSASKENMVEKIGMFGLGFNTVYHVTDIPSILSGNTLLILDPNITHLKRRIKHKSNPGIKLELSRSICSGFLVNSLHMKVESYLSEISSKVYYKSDILSFQKHFTHDSQFHLLFLKSIKTVSLQTASSCASTPLKSGDITDIFTVSKTTLCRMDIPEESPALMQQDAEKFKVDIVEITCHQSVETQVQRWLLCSCFGTSDSLNLAMQKNKKVVFSLPVGGVAIPLQFNNEAETYEASQTNIAGKAFCFLPLSIDTGLPFNVNGTFAVTSNRKTLWESGVKHEWNRSLLQDPILSAFITALLALKNMSLSKQLDKYCYHTFWPQREHVSENFRPLVDAFYCTIAQNGSAPKLFSDGEHWFSLESAIIFHEDIEQDQNIFPLAMQVCQKHVKSNHAVSLPTWIRNGFKLAGLESVLQDKTWNWERFYKEAVFAHLDQLDPEWRDTLMLHAINLNMKEIDSLLVAYPCIPTTSGQLQYICKLVNPNGKVVCLFEHGEGRTLGGTTNDFRSPKNVLRLENLGMASDILSLEEITKKAKAISQVWVKDKNKAYENIKCLLDLLKLHLQSDSSPFWKELQATSFMPAFRPGDAKMEREVMLERPAHVFTDKCALLVNMKEPVLELSRLKIHSSDPVLQMLNVKNNPGPALVLQQLKEANAQCQSMDKPVLHKIAYECYKFLDHQLCDSEEDMRNRILQCAKSFTFVLVGDTFVNISCVAERAQVEAKPYLYSLPHQFKHFRTLWEMTGVEKEFTISQYMNALSSISAKHGNKPLTQSDLSICLTILNRGIFEPHKKVKNCLVPNKKSILQPAQTLFYNDSPWMPVKKRVNLCHENISRPMAIHLGVKTTRHHTLMSNVVENMSPFAFQFEQQEQLTVRIRNIISAYPAKKDILKELIQNADDAEATEINFQLGEGGKHNALGKTGKYGLGFNSVYHLTDCPSILTGDKLLCISDPNQNYIESTSDVSPAGIGYNLVDSFKEMYMDVYRTFLPDTFPLREGTMFRLPLRTDAMARTSEISRESVTENDMKELCSALSEEPEGLILFLRSIRKINVYEMDKDGELKIIYKKKVFDEGKQCALKSDKPIDQKVIYGTVISTSQKKLTKWIVAERFVKNTDDRQSMAIGKLAQASVATRLNLKNEPKSDLNGEAFCSLPLPGHTGLPVHVNANFEVDSSRRNLWKEDGQSCKMKWNEYLKQTVIAPLYADLLDYLHSNLPNKKDYKMKSEQFLIESYLCFFPIVNKSVHPEWHEMVHEVYRSIQLKSLNVIPVFKGSTQVNVDNQRSQVKLYSFNWSSIAETDPTERPYLPREEVSTKIIPLDILDILEDVGMKLVPLSMQNVWSSFQSAGINLDYVTPSTVQRFLRAKPLNDPSQTEEQLPLPVSQTLIKDGKRCTELLSFCLKDLEADKEKDTKVNHSVIEGLPLLLTKDKILRVFNLNSPKFATPYDRLFIKYEKHFADYQTIKPIIFTLKNQYLKPLIKCFLQTCDVDPHKKLYIPSENMLEWLNFFWKFIISQLQTCADLTISSVKQLYSECCILPVICPQTKQKYLKMMRDMPSVIMFYSDRDLSSTLFELGFLKLDTAFFREMDREWHSLLSSELLNVTNSSSVLDQLYNRSIVEFSQLDSSKIDELQSFLNSGVSKAKDIQDYQRKFRSLLLFETINCERVRIDGSKHIYTLNIQALSDLDFFVLFLLPVVHKLTERQTQDCLKLLLSLQHDYNFSNSKDRILSTFRNVRLIRNSLGQLQLVSYFYDNDVELFRVMLPTERFVPKTFLDEMTKDSICRDIDLNFLLKELGMKHTVTAEDIATFAQQIENEVKRKEHLENLKKKSSIVFRAALKFAEDRENNRNKLVQNIAHLCDYHPSFTSEDSAVSISGALIEGEEKHQERIWSSMSIIHVPVYRSKEVQQVLSSAGAFEKPPSEYVAKNLKNMPDTLVFQSCYAFLQNLPDPSQSLDRLPVVLVEKNKKLVKAEDVCFSLDYDSDFRPYFYRIPSELGLYKDFFTNIGVRTEPSVSQFCNILAALYSETCNKPNLQPNQQKTVKRAVQQLFKLVKEQKQCLDDIKILYLPGVNGKLMESHKLYYNDTSFVAERIEQALPEKFVLLEKLSNCHMKSDVYEHHKLINSSHRNFSPKLERQMELCERNCEFGGFFEEHISSAVFQYGLICLIRAELEGNVSQEEAKEMCNATFGRLKIVCCQSLQTELWLEKQQLPKTAAETEVYVKKGQQGCTFYLQHNDLNYTGINQVSQTLAMEINNLLGTILGSQKLMACSSLITCDDLKQVRKILEKNQIYDSVEVESLHLSPPAPGTEIPEEWHDALDMSILNNFEEGEYVGYYANEKYIYAIIVEELSGHTTQLTQRYKVNIGKEEPVEVGFLDLFQFKREKQSPPPSSSSWELQLVEGASSTLPNKTQGPRRLLLKRPRKKLTKVWMRFGIFLQRRDTKPSRDSI
ncbi:hypothetical protein WMY93_017684 [Mugilogobius chulae]|uniref:Sacsin/Nov domain-containing protein n=1 Tax=Mugilogobius chulae TaxID=88201 RepID=A0AAW0NTT2_9GOBI